MGLGGQISWPWCPENEKYIRVLVFCEVFCLLKPQNSHFDNPGYATESLIGSSSKNNYCITKAKIFIQLTNNNLT